jgi:hypothetical protein
MDKIYYLIVGFFAERTKIILSWEQVQIIKKLRRLAKAYQRQAENDCNGEGFIPRKGFFTFNDKSAYADEERTVFDVESERLHDLIVEEVKDLNTSIADRQGIFNIEFQGDPRGYTVKLSLFNGINLSEILFE